MLLHIRLISQGLLIDYVPIKNPNDLSKSLKDLADPLSNSFMRLFRGNNKKFIIKVTSYK